MRILVIADCPVAELVRKGLEPDGTAVEAASTNTPLDVAGSAFKYDAVLLESGQVKAPGWERVAAWRREGLDAHVLVVLPKHSNGEERAAYLDAGADGCLLHPLSLDELKAHLRALHRRAQMQPSPVRRVHDLELNTARAAPSAPAGRFT